MASITQLTDKIFDALVEMGVDVTPIAMFGGKEANMAFMDKVTKALQASEFIQEKANVYNKDIVKEAIHTVLEKKKKRDRCLRIADRKFKKASAYKSGAVVRCRKGNIWKGLKEEHQPLTEKQKETLRTWFKRKGAPGKTGGWVDCNSPIRKDGKITGYKPCGRQKGEKRSYPACRPTASQCKDKGKGKTWGKKAAK